MPREQDGDVRDRAPQVTKGAGHDPGGESLGRGAAQVMHEA
jgi:hypothetical protein